MGQITSGIAAELGASRYLMLLADTELDGQMELEYLKMCIRDRHIAARKQESPDYYDRMPDLTGKTSWQQLDTTQMCIRDRSGR